MTGIALRERPYVTLTTTNVTSSCCGSVPRKASTSRNTASRICSALPILARPRGESIEAVRLSLVVHGFVDSVAVHHEHVAGRVGYDLLRHACAKSRAEGSE